MLQTACGDSALGFDSELKRLKIGSITDISVTETGQWTNSVGQKKAHEKW